MKLSIIGPGMVGQSLGHLIASMTPITIHQIVCRDINKGLKAQRYIGQGEVINELAYLQNCDLLMIATPDDIIAEVSANIPKNVLSSSTIVFHCSGALSSKDLDINYPCLKASVHPLNSFSQLMAIESFQGTWCAIEGNDQACQQLTTLFKSIRANTIKLSAQDKIKWHLAASIACNGLNALIQSSLQVFKQIGLDSDVALSALAPIMQHTLKQIIALGPSQALTGPIARGDITTIEHHLASLSSQTQLEMFYKQLAMTQLTLSHQKKAIDPLTASKLESLLKQSP